MTNRIQQLKDTLLAARQEAELEVIKQNNLDANSIFSILDDSVHNNAEIRKIQNAIYALDGAKLAK